MFMINMELMGIYKDLIINNKERVKIDHDYNR